MLTGGRTSRSSSRSCSLVSVMVRSSLGTALIVLGLQVAVHEVDLLQPAKALADVLRPDLSDPLDRLELRVGRGEHLVQTAELLDDLLDDELRQAGDAPEDPVAAGRHRIVERVELAVVPHEL